jgi:hypothetical protein
MSRARMAATAVVISAAALIAASGALAATPQQIYNDYADNGKLDRHYSPADLRRALTNAVVQAYGSDNQNGLTSAAEQQTSQSTSSSGTSGGTAGETAGTTSPAPVTTTGGLPFTGLDLSLITIGALGLMLLGMALRRVARQRS